MRTRDIVFTVLICAFLISGLAAASDSGKGAFRKALPSEKVKPLEMKGVAKSRKGGEVVEAPLVWFTAEAPSWNDEITGRPWDAVDFTVLWGDTLWHRDNVNACDGSYGMWCGDPDVGPGGGYLDNRWQALISPPITLSADQDSVFLIYSHWLRCEECHEFPTFYSWDGYNVRIDLASDEATFFEIKPYHVDFDSSYYDSGNRSRNSKEWRELRCWERHGETEGVNWVMGGFSQDTSSACSKKVFDLRPYAGETVQLEFVFASDWATNTMNDPTWFGLVLDDVLIAEGLDSLTIATMPAELGGDTLFYDGFEGAPQAWEVNVKYPAGNFWWLASGGHAGSYKAMCSDPFTGNIPSVCENAVVSPKIARDRCPAGATGMRIDWYLKCEIDFASGGAYNRYKLDDGDWENISVLTHPNGKSYVYGLGGLTDDSWWSTDLWRDFMTDLSPLVTDPGIVWDTLQVCVGFESGTYDIINTVGLQVDDITVLLAHNGGAIGGTVSGPAGPIEGATVTAQGAASASATTNGNGDYSIDPLPIGLYNVTVSAPGYRTETESDVEVWDETTTTVDFLLDVAVSDLVWSTVLKGSGWDTEEGNGIFVDESGGIYIIGATRSSDFPVTTGAFDETHNGNQDAFAAKLSSSGDALDYATFVGGSSNDRAYDIAVDDQGCAYMVGFTDGSDFPATVGAYDETHNGSRDAFVAKLNATGSNLEYATFLGGGEDDRGKSIALSGAGNAFVTGQTRSQDFPATSGAFDESFNDGVVDAFVVKLNSAGSSLEYSSFLGGRSSDWGEGIAVDGAGQAYVTGRTYSVNFPATPGAYSTTIGGRHDVFVAKLNTAGGSLEYATFLGGTDDDKGYDIVVDNGGKAYLTGSTLSADFPVAGGGLGSAPGGEADVFVARLSAPGSDLEYASYLGGACRDGGEAIAVDASGNMYVTGATECFDPGSAMHPFPSTPGAFDEGYNGALDVFVARFSATDGSLSYSTFLGGSSSEYGTGIAVNGLGEVFVSGTSKSGDFPTTAGAFEEDPSGGSNAFVAKLSIRQP